MWKLSSRQLNWRLMMNKYARQLREKGLCIDCGKYPLSSKNHCYSCRLKVNVRALKKYHDNAAYRQTVKYRSEQVYSVRQDLNVCLGCGSSEKFNKSRCASCAIAHRESSRKRINAVYRIYSAKSYEIDTGRHERENRKHIMHQKNTA